MASPLPPTPSGTNASEDNAPQSKAEPPIIKGVFAGLFAFAVVTSIFNGVGTAIDNNELEDLLGSNMHSLPLKPYPLEEGNCYYQAPDKVRQVTFQRLDGDDFLTGVKSTFPSLFDENALQQHFTAYSLGELPIIEQASCAALKDGIAIKPADVAALTARALHAFQNQPLPDGLDDKVEGRLVFTVATFTP